MTSIHQDVAAYENWLRSQCDVVEADLEAKHRRMRKSAFDFLRATYFRWARTIEAVSPDAATAVPVLGIGDIHVENYGTWRDADARLVWGINDFDEAAELPYTLDLVRLATSALLAPDPHLAESDVASALLRGYRRGLTSPRAALLDRDSLWMRPYVNPTMKSNKEFWRDLTESPNADPPATVRKTLSESLPQGAKIERFASRQKGGGSLGRSRFLVIASWNSGSVIREAKAVVPSAWLWAHGATGPNVALDVAFGLHRSPDPHLRLVEGFIIRRIAPDSRKIDVDEVHENGLSAELLSAMAEDLASVHCATAAAPKILEDLDSREDRWLRDAAKAAAKATIRDFEDFAQP